MAKARRRKPKKKPRFLKAIFNHTQSQRLLIAWAPIAALLPVAAILYGGLSPLAFLGLLALGWFGWTPVEYVMHRWGMHWRPPARIDLWRLRERLLPHDDHHDRPDAPTVAIIDPPGPPIATCVVLAASMALWLPWPAAITIAFGGGLGYVSYELVHFATHKCRMENRLAAFWMRHHLFHHYRNETVNFGVTTPIWDLVFGTYFRPGKVRRAAA